MATDHSSGTRRISKTITVTQNAVWTRKSIVWKGWELRNLKFLQNCLDLGGFLQSSKALGGGLRRK